MLTPNQQVLTTSVIAKTGETICIRLECDDEDSAVDDEDTASTSTAEMHSHHAPEEEKTKEIDSGPLRPTTILVAENRNRLSSSSPTRNMFFTLNFKKKQKASRDGMLTPNPGMYSSDRNPIVFIERSVSQTGLGPDRQPASHQEDFNGGSSSHSTSAASLKSFPSTMNSSQLTELSFQSSASSCSKLNEMHQPDSSTEMDHYHYMAALLPRKGPEWTRQLHEATGVSLFNTKPVKGINYLLKHQVVDLKPSSISQFLASRQINRLAIGEYFGSLNDPLAPEVANTFISQLDMVGKEIDEALRVMMTAFHPSGESQKISSLVTMFRRAYVDQNPALVEQRFRNPETIEVMAYSIFMLHTDLYNPNAHRSMRAMTRDQFVRNNKGIDDGQNLCSEFLAEVYDRIAAKKIESQPDQMDVLRGMEKLLQGPLKTDKFVLRHRRFQGACMAQETPEIQSKGPALKSTLHVRALFAFNDILLITKATQESSLLDTPSNTHHHNPAHIRRRSPKPPMNRSALTPTTTNGNDCALVSSSIHQLHHESASTNPSPQLGRRFPPANTRTATEEPPKQGQFFIKSIMSLLNMSVLQFSTSHAKFGLQLRESKATGGKVINLVFASADDRAQFQQWCEMASAEMQEFTAALQ